MAGTSENPKIGLDNVVIAELISDDGINPPVYGAVIPLRGAVQASANPNSSVEVDYADNGAFFVTGNRANTELSMELTNVDPAVLAKMLGQRRENGVTIETPMDQSPYFAMGFRIWIGGTDENGNNIYQYVWYAKGKFSVPESGGTTKQEGVDFQHVSMTAQFVSTQYKDSVKKAGIFCAHCRSDSSDAPNSLIENWFNQPILLPNSDMNPVVVTISKSGSNITITGEKDEDGDALFALDSAKLNESVIILDASGVVNGSFAISSNKKTITFTPDSALSGSVNVTVTNGLKDVNGVGVTPANQALTF